VIERRAELLGGGNMKRPTPCWTDDPLDRRTTASKLFRANLILRVISKVDLALENISSTYDHADLSGYTVGDSGI
jgi:hypothetical protein